MRLQAHYTPIALFFFAIPTYAAPVPGQTIELRYVTRKLFYLPYN
jgi:hypothetical protein